MFLLGRYSRSKKVIELTRTIEVMRPAVLRWVDVSADKRFNKGSVIEDPRHAWVNFCGEDYAFTDNELVAPKNRAKRLKNRGIHP